MAASSDHLNRYWSELPERLQAALRSTANGLATADARQRLAEFGPNVLEARERATPLKLFLGQFKRPIVLILLFATGVSAATQEWADAVIILVIVLGSALLSFFQEYSANTAAEKLRAQVTIKTTVLRDGQSQSVPAREVVAGDVVLLSAGSLVPAAGVLLEARDFYVNQAVLTGETFPVEKRPDPVAAQAGLLKRTNCVFVGTNVRSGSARALIVQTGTGTAFGQIAERLTLRPPETEFERGIRRFGYLLTEVMLVLVLIVFAINVFFHKPVLDSLLFSIALAVGLTPQLLPAIISINLSKGSQTMAVHGVIVRRLESIENFGSMDTLCTDKTGTLTEGVVQLDGALDLAGQPSDEVFWYADLNAHLSIGRSRHPGSVPNRLVPGVGPYGVVDPDGNPHPAALIQERARPVFDHLGTDCCRGHPDPTLLSLEGSAGVHVAAPVASPAAARHHGALHHFVRGSEAVLL
jgi:Mg2+-importing ATPase